MRYPSERCQRSKQQALVLLLVRQLTDAQFRRADHRASQGLWQEVAALEIDPDRITALLYSGIDPEDREALRAEDEAWQGRQPQPQPQPQRRGWTLQRLHLGRPGRPKTALTPA